MLPTPRGLVQRDARPGPRGGSGGVGDRPLGRARGRGADGPGRKAALLSALLVAAGLPTALDAQDAGGVFLDGGVSHSLSPSGSPVGPSTYGLGGLRLDWSPGAGSRLFLSGYGGLSFDEAAGDWGSVTAGFDLWTPVGRVLGLGLSGRGEAFTVGPPFEYRAVEGELRPRISLRLDQTLLTLEGVGALGQSEVTIRDSPELPAGVVPTGEVVTDLWMWGVGPELSFPAGPTSLSLGGKVYESRDRYYRRARLGISGSAGPFTLSADVAVWDTPGDGEVTGGLTLQLPVGDGASVTGAGRRAGPDPLLGTPASGQGSVTGSLRLAGFGGDRDRLRIYSIDRREGTTVVTFRVRRPEADRVSVLGDFSGWEPVEMERRDGLWTVSVEVGPGVHHFGFRVDGEWYVPDDAPGRTPDDWGRVNATLVVQE